jgi:ABC-type Fe3+/spermidine/putrescine transport system ATPase subunit
MVVVHDRAEAWALADRLLILLDGRIVAEGAPHRLLTAPPTLEVARFLGFDGELRGAGGVVTLTRPQHVHLDPAGPLRARVEALIPTEDGVRLTLDLEPGRLHALAALPAAPRPGDRVRLRLSGGVRFSAGGQPLEAADPTVAPAVAQSPSP